MDQIYVSRMTINNFPRCVMRAALILAIGIGAADTSKSEIASQEEAGYVSWQERFRRFKIPMRNESRDLDDPEVSLDVARMFRESDLILECTLGKYLTGGTYLRLLVRIDTIEGIYKGKIFAAGFEPEKGDHLICVMQDEMAYHAPFVRIQTDKKSRYLLFLKTVPDEERQVRGYTDVKAKLFKVYRVWQGAIRLDGKSYLEGDANYQLYRDRRFGKLPLSPPDILDAVKLLAANGAASEAAMTRVAWESRYLNALIDDKTGSIREAVPDEFRNLPADVLETFTAEILRSRHAACHDPEKKLALAARIRFRAIVWGDLAAVPPE